MPRLQKRLQIAKKAGFNSRHSGINWVEKSKHYQFGDRKSRDVEIARLEEEINASTLPPLSPFSLKTGEIGSLPDKSKGFGLCEPDGFVIPWEFEVVQILDKKTAMISVEGRSSNTRFFLISPLVKDLQEGQVHNSLPGAFVVAGNRQYKMALGGVSTIPVLQTYDLTPHLEKLKQKKTP
jgi:hypothetical protein